MKILTASLIVFLSFTVHADLFTGSADFTSSSVDLEFTGAITGSDTISVTQGGVNLILSGTDGVWETLTLTGGSFDIADASVPLTVAGNPPTSDTLTTSGFGFSVLNSVLSLTPNGNSYQVGGTLNATADEGVVSLLTNGSSANFNNTPETIAADLLNTSSLTIVDSDPNDGEVSLTGALRFGDQPILDLGVASMTISSVNTLNFGGTLAIPEPSVAGLLLLGLLVLRLKRR